MAADHQGRGEWPGLAGEYSDVRDRDAGLFPAARARRRPRSIRPARGSRPAPNSGLGGYCGWRPSRSRPSCSASMITTGSTRGKCCAEHSGSAATSRRARSRVFAPQLAQKRWRECHQARLSAACEQRRFVVGERPDRVERRAGIGVRLLRGGEARLSVLNAEEQARARSPPAIRACPSAPTAGRPSRQTSWRTSSPAAISASRASSTRTWSARSIPGPEKKGSGGKRASSTQGPIRRRGGKALAGRPRRGRSSGCHQPSPVGLGRGDDR